MSDVTKKYKAILDRLVAGRDGGSLTEQQEDTLLDELDDLWLQMTNEEHDALDESTLA